MSLDEKGITLSEIRGKYPPSFQTLNYDILMDVDSMYKPKVISSFEMIINSILMLLFMKPGQYPSIPELGIDIESYLHEYSDDKSIPMKIKTKLIELDEKYHKLTEKFRTKYVATTCSNLKEEFDKFISAKKMGQKYYPQLEIENSNVDNKLIENFEKLKNEFKEIKDDCYITKFYLDL